MDSNSSSSLNISEASNNEENIELFQISIGDLDSSTSQYHLKAENGQITYKIINIDGPAKKGSTTDISTLTFDPNLISLQKMNSTHSSLKRKISSANQTENKDKNKDEKRSKHNEIERKRRDKINSWIIKLSKIVPDCNDNGKQAQPKGTILSKACDYITQLSKNNVKLNSVFEENNKLRKELNEYKKEISDLESEIDDLKELLEKNGIVVKESK